MTLTNEESMALLRMLECLEEIDCVVPCRKTGYRMAMYEGQGVRLDDLNLVRRACELAPVLDPDDDHG